ncbi:cell division protein FtsQ/DivIB [Gilvimarinus xylanilyticus]|uniref:Cell division protein FtsQ n=1 Tax=Gilvimarinus xylanilyticus TaxID=2944139 RepID=A0A9X2I160_9GAMM|nr:cell division protein FtsQ/DivIB [Gilvimarinus xylanilyticus]MCP8900241.1 cell division protein FtsQ/DivIB [Gilvimarinus xylanilyticus]
MNTQPRRAKGHRQATPKGAVRRGARDFSGVKRAFALLQKATLVALVVGLAAGLYHFGGQALNSWLRHPVDEVRVEGQFVHIDRAQATELIGNAIDREYVELDLAQLKSKIEAHPWVERAVISRELPSGLSVTLVEQVPIARWGDNGFLNQRGEIIVTDDLADLAQLPQLSGRDVESEEIMRQYQDFSRVLRSRNLSVARLWVDELDTWRLQLRGRAELVLGSSDVPERLQRFLRVYDEHLIQHFDAVVRVDLRYANGLAVSWSDAYDVTIETTG